MILKLFFILNSLFFYDPDYRILFIGHAYGSGEIINQGDSSFQRYVEHYSDNHDLYVFGGDFIKNCKSDIELKNFKTSISSIYDKSIFIYGNHEYYCYDSEKMNFLKSFENTSITYNDNIFFFINSNFTSRKDLDLAISKVSEGVDYSRVFIFSHQVFFEKSDFLLRTNSREYYELGYEFYDRINKLNFNDLYIISGDIGTTKYLHHLVYYKKNNISLIASGLGNEINNYAVEISFNQNNQLSFYKINLDNDTKQEIKSKHRYKIYSKNLFLFFVEKSQSKKAVVLYCIAILLFLGYKKKSSFFN